MESLDCKYIKKEKSFVIAAVAYTFILNLLNTISFLIFCPALYFLFSDSTPGILAECQQMDG